MSANSPQYLMSTHIVYRCVYKGIIGPPSPSPRSAQGNVRGISERKEREEELVACRVRYQSFFLPSLRQFRLPLLASSLPFSLPLPYSTDSQIPRRQTTKTAREGGRGRVKKEGWYTAPLPAPAPVSTPTIVLGVRVPKIIYYVRKNLFVGRHRYRLRCRRAA